MVMHGSTKYVPKHIKEQRMNQAVIAPAPVATKPDPPRIRAEVEPPTTNLTLYGETPAPSCPSGFDPKTYKTREWKSFTHAQFQPLPYVATSKEIQNERVRSQMASDLSLNQESLQVFNPSVGFAGRETQAKSDFRPLEREWYVNRPATFAVGGGGVPQGGSIGNATGGGARGGLNTSQANGSGTLLKGTGSLEPHMYETLTKRQFQPYPIDGAMNAIDKSRRWENKKDMVASHFVIGTDKQRLVSTAKEHLPSEKPQVKNSVLRTAPMDADHNPHVVRDASDARPKNLTPKEVAYRKATSHVPVLTRNNPEYGQYGGLPNTTTQYATPLWNPDRPQGWRMSSNGEGGVRLGHDDRYEAMPDGTFSPKRRALTSLDGPQEEGKTVPTVPRATVGGSAVNAVRGVVSVHNKSNATSNHSTITGTARPGSDDPRWISASKAAYKGFQYQH